jgi:transcription-repair coupling factor (superfamily II helicase)
MNENFLSELTNLNFFSKLISEITSKKLEKNKLYISPLSGSAKSLIVALLGKKEKQILVLLPSRQLVNELNVELTILGSDENVIAIDSIEADSIQEKLTSINNKNSAIIISTYEVLKVKLPSKDIIEKNTTKIETGSEITYDDLVEYLDEIN